LERQLGLGKKKRFTNSDKNVHSKNPKVFPGHIRFVLMLKCSFQVSFNEIKFSSEF